MTSPTITHDRRTPGRRPGRVQATTPPPLPLEQTEACEVSIKCVEHGVHTCGRRADVKLMLTCPDDGTRSVVDACGQHPAGIGSWPAVCSTCGRRLRLVGVPKVGWS